MGDLTLFEALTGGAFDCQNWQHSGEFEQTFSKSQMPRGLPGGMGGFGIDRYITATPVICLFSILFASLKYTLLSLVQLLRNSWR